MYVDKNGEFHSPEWTNFNERSFKAILENYKSKEILEGLYEGQAKNPGICPRCSKGKAGSGTALSRRAKVMICSACGTEEAMMDAGGESPLPFQEWDYIKKQEGKQVK